MPVLGLLVTRGDWLTALLGATEYGAIADAVAGAADDPAVRGILLEVNSPGGEVGGLFDLVDAIGTIKTRSGKPLWAVASESALSAAYAIASLADRLYVTRTGEVGSVGVVAVHIDESSSDAMAGLKWTLIHAGARKTDGNPHEPLSPRATADIQADVDALHDELVAVVAGNRGPELPRPFAPPRRRSTAARRRSGPVSPIASALWRKPSPIWRRRCRRSASAPVRRADHRSPGRSPALTTIKDPAMNTSDPLIGETDAASPEDAAGKMKSRRI